MNKQQLLQSLRERGFLRKIVSAFDKVKRENFIPQSLRGVSYEDTALPIGENQTISQPYTIAVMLSLLDIKPKKNQKVLEVGSGCGYVLALLSEIFGESGRIFGVEIIKELVEKSRENLKNYPNIKVFKRDGSLGLSEYELFDRIIISAACEKIPEPLISQLKNTGIIVAPLGKRHEQSLTAFKKIKGKLKKINQIPGFIFVPFIGKKES